MSRRTCSAIKEGGGPCGATPLADAPYCFWHDPEHQQEAQEARRLGGLRRRREGTVSGAYGFDGIKTVPAVQRILEIAIIDTISLDNSPARNRTLGSLAGIALKALEVGELEARLEAVEAALGPRLQRKTNERRWNR